MFPAPRDLVVRRELCVRRRPSAVSKTRRGPETLPQGLVIGHWLLRSPQLSLERPRKSSPIALTTAGSSARAGLPAAARWARDVGFRDRRAGGARTGARASGW